MSTPEPPPRPPVPPTQPTEALPRRPVQPVARPAVAPPVVEQLPLALPPERAWSENPWPAILTGLLALIVGGLIGYLIGNNNNESPGTTARGPAAVVTHTQTVVRPEVKVRTNTVTNSTVTQTPQPINVENEARRKQAETDLRKAERENEELRNQLNQG